MIRGSVATILARIYRIRQEVHRHVHSRDGSGSVRCSLVLMPLKGPHHDYYRTNNS